MDGGAVSNLVDIWIKCRETIQEQLSEERKKADAFAQKLCDGALANWSEMESFINDPEQIVAKLVLDISVDISGIRTPVIKDAINDYINSANNEGLDVSFSCVKSDVEHKQMLLLITKKEQSEGDK